MDKLVEMLIQLAECRLNVGAWLEWWDENQDELKAVLSQADYIRIKPKFRDTPIVYRILAGSQAGAEKYLKKNNISFIHSDFYAKRAEADWQTHLENQKQKLKSAEIRNRQERKRLVKSLPYMELSAIHLDNNHSLFFNKLSSLAEAYRKLGAKVEYEHGEPISEKEILLFEEEINDVLPEALKNFFQHYGTIHFPPSFLKTG